MENYIKYSLDFLCPIKTTELFEAVNWVADLPQRAWPQAGRRERGVILLKSTAAVLVAAMFVGDRMTALPSRAGATAVATTDHRRIWQTCVSTCRQLLVVIFFILLPI